MSIAEMTVASSPAPHHGSRARHTHTWELRAVEYDTWGQVSLYECLGCPGVRYV